ncbi:hypothetical protein A2U01_0070442, partial [Trifolium medium]|nr:hypothetical protein [Trifolium medium]
LARLQEEKIQDLLRLTKPKPSNSWWPGPSTARSAVSPPMRTTPETTTPIPNSPLLPTTQPKTRFRQLTST